MKRADGLFIVTDMDGTLLDRDGKIPANNLAAIRRFTDAGGLFTVASGRYGDKLPWLFPQYREYVNAPLILCNGACIYDHVSDTNIREITGDTDKLFPVLREMHVLFPELEMVAIVRRGELVSIDWQELDEPRYYKIVTIGNPGMLDRVRAFLTEKYAGKWALSKSCADLLEMLIPQGTKGRALDWLRGYYAAKGERVHITAVGDYENDLDLLLAADRAACPANAIDEVKRISAVHLCDNNTGALADLIDRILDTNDWRDEI